jgi:hypothetical protein
MQHIFGNPIFISLVIAMGLGIAMGLERFIAGKPAGMRTYALISMGSALFVIISQAVATQSLSYNFDPLRCTSGRSCRISWGRRNVPQRQPSDRRHHSKRYVGCGRSWYGVRLWVLLSCSHCNNPHTLYFYGALVYRKADPQVLSSRRHDKPFSLKIFVIQY